jgi:hypothetical protein
MGIFIGFVDGSSGKEAGAQRSASIQMKGKARFDFEG